jgi:hypothetical protein
MADTSWFHLKAELCARLAADRRRSDASKMRQEVRRKKSGEQ